eukprot:10682967-Karenia_brevis.AAC.1
MSQRQRDLLPLPLPFPACGQLVAAKPRSRAMQRRLHARGAWQTWCNDAVLTINNLNGCSGFSKCRANRSQQA